MCELKMAGQGISYAVPIHVMRWHVLGCLSPQGRLVHADHDGAPESHDYVCRRWRDETRLFAPRNGSSA